MAAQVQQATRQKKVPNFYSFAIQEEAQPAIEEAKKQFGQSKEAQIHLLVRNPKEEKKEKDTTEKKETKNLQKEKEEIRMQYI